jgi:KDO2-lipid IV(A) lauroyltransferase
MELRQTERPPFSPRYWPGWVGVGCLWLLGKLPQPAGLALSVPLSGIISVAMKSRRKIAERNIERCFPELDADEREDLIRRNFRALARMLFEIAWSWSASSRRIGRMGRVDGWERVERAQEAGDGVLLITAHLTCLEIGGRLIGETWSGASGIYRPLRSPVLEWYQNRSRGQYSCGGISKRDMRSAIRFLRSGGVLWYAPDQDFGPKQSTFAPFFGISAATLEATVRLVELTGCRVIPMFPLYDKATRRYTVQLLPELENFPSGDLVADLSRVNRLMEEQIRGAPEQYWWIHRRFKTRPEGEPPFYD